jgi:hypothetical protein
MSPKTPVSVIGYAPHGNVMDQFILEDYRDFPVGMKMDLETARACLDRGVFPPGVVLYCTGGKPGVVRGVYGNEHIEVVK